MASQALAQLTSPEFGQAPAKAGRSATDLARTQSARAMERVTLYGGGSDVDVSLALRSPIAGVIVERNINPGEELRLESAGPGVPALFVAADPSQLWLQRDATECDLPYLKPGAVVDLGLNAYPDEPFKARIVAIADFPDPGTRTNKVRGLVPNLGRRLKGDMYVTGVVRREIRSAV